MVNGEDYVRILQDELRRVSDQYGIKKFSFEGADLEDALLGIDLPREIEDSIGVEENLFELSSGRRGVYDQYLFSFEYLYSGKTRMTVEIENFFYAAIPEAGNANVQCDTPYGEDVEIRDEGIKLACEEIDHYVSMMRDVLVLVEKEM